jgi:tRNA U34 5-methylaminomethyl-2-thiouridine-forming methyltransferase MnmC
MKAIESINDILDSEEFNNFFDFEAEKKEIEAAGWSYEEITSFARQLAKKIDKKSKKK